MPRKERQKATDVPAFRSVREEAEFWDTHDFTEYQEGFSPVRVRFARNLSEGITVRLDPGTLNELREIAREKGIGPTTLVRMWILERLRQSA